jgi:hypothetical protein
MCFLVHDVAVETICTLAKSYFKPVQMALANSDRYGRSLEHSKVLYEGDTPILRLAWNKQDPSYIGMPHCPAVVFPAR